MRPTAFVCFALWALTSSAAAQTFPYDHVHLNVPDPAAGANWYEKYFGGRRLAEGPDRLMFGSTRFLFIKKADAKPSSGGAIGNLRAQGVTVLTEPSPLPLANGPSINFSYVAGPAGAKIEIVERTGLKPGQ